MSNDSWFVTTLFWPHFYPLLLRRPMYKPVKSYSPERLVLLYRSLLLQSSVNRGLVSYRWVRRGVWVRLPCKDNDTTVSLSFKITFLILETFSLSLRIQARVVKSYTHLGSYHYGWSNTTKPLIYIIIYILVCYV